MELYLSGRIDTGTAPELRQAIADIPRNTPSLTLDFRDVPMITSAGMRELVVCGRRFSRERLRLTNVNSDIITVFKTVGFDSIFTIEEMVEDVSTYIHMSIKELLAHHVSTGADQIVLRSEEELFTWYDIERASQIIAEDLARLGVGAGSHVGICGGNSVNWVLTFYATQKLGAIAMLINPTQSAQEIGKICGIGDITCLCYGEIPAMKDEVAFLEEVRAASEGKLTRNYSIRSSVRLRTRFGEYEALKGKYEQKVEGDAPCVVIFTSGSTGKPKGVIPAHDQPGQEPADRAAVPHPGPGGVLPALRHDQRGAVHSG